uniref:Photosystem II protein T n=11 Tax=Podophylloideae TaxID=1461176 RepID=A0A2R3ZTB1_ACHTR|nr:photosystem II protein T [Achlys triphylla]YP_009490730.1 photosystem II protein T [Dysosma delavayi]YP_009490811.1 photosystem II protein T [Dysosma majoensis]YP_009490894.1 photosystem II protein T [Diphylleia grayi]YP_009490977.1 photosystem II protein T [Dysosma aurantiocaulis]YP_009491141.1 photosystem II protein T [Dysosma tsayuensis]YP_009491224.1 photosystem II protein T [Dysosma pleiantha]YP_009491307.1 photosystem II protein T [Dysosma difformis]YP_009491390.1 photosystem II pr
MEFIYGSIGLYIPLSLDSRNHFFRYLFSRTT